MKISDMQIAAKQAMTIERVARFEVGMVQSITVTAHMHSVSAEGRNNTVSIRVLEDDPRFATLDAMIREEAVSEKTKAEAALTALGVAVEVPQEVKDAAAADAAAGKAAYDDALERNRIKKIMAEAAAAAKSEKKAKA
jgi:hypothetical protein